MGWQTNWAPEDIRAHIDFQLALNKELTDQGELVDAQGLAGPDGHYRLDAVRAHLFEMAGDAEAAVAHYRAAASRTTSIPEQHYLAALAARLRVQTGSGGRLVNRPRDEGDSRR